MKVGNKNCRESQRHDWACFGCRNFGKSLPESLVLVQRRFLTMFQVIRILLDGNSLLIEFVHQCVDIYVVDGTTADLLKVNVDNMLEVLGRSSDAKAAARFRHFCASSLCRNRHGLRGRFVASSSVRGLMAISSFTTRTIPRVETAY